MLHDSRLLLFGRDRLFGQPGWYRVVECDACGMKYVNPRPTWEALTRHYPSDYFPVRLPEDTPRWARPLVRALVNLRWLAYFWSVERVTGAIAADAKVVDVGCGLNNMLVLLERLRGCRGLGVDISSQVVAYVRDRLRMPISHGTLQDARLQAATFDLVTMSEYLEHEPEPRYMLDEARRISKPGAYLVVEVPYMGGLPSRMFGSCWSQLDVPRHLAFYTPGTMAKMLEQCGYRPVHVTTMGAPFSFGISVLQSLGFKKLGQMRPINAFLVLAAGIPFLPFFPWLREFMLVVARAE
jgi:SAM-dependent methyltransferase